MCLANSPIAAQAVAERHGLDVGAAVGVRPARGIGRAAVKTRHALQEALAPEGRGSLTGMGWLCRLIYCVCVRVSVLLLHCSLHI